MLLTDTILPMGMKGKPMRAKDGSECKLSVRRGAHVRVFDFERLIQFANCPLKCVIWFSSSITC